MATSEILVTALSGPRCKTRKAKKPSVEELERDVLKNPDGTSTSPKVTEITRKALSPTVGSLRNHDGNGNGNVGEQKI